MAKRRENELARSLILSVVAHGVVGVWLGLWAKSADQKVAGYSANQRLAHKGKEASYFFGLGLNQGATAIEVLHELGTQRDHPHSDHQRPPKKPSFKPSQRVAQISRSVPLRGGSQGDAAASGASFSALHLSGGGTKVVEQPLSAGTGVEDYFLELRRIIDSQKKYPPLARSLGHQGQVSITFQVGRDGVLGPPRLMGSSGSPALDQAALELVRQIKRVPTPPEHLPDEALWITVPLVYSLN